ncbi:NADPH-dependent FMN reductase [Curvibacter sp. RS43]|uniref:NADPH-dependent FMN reductase n=1 Tax=Curvibacter microcysteis TaxID=3026419 RepID=A0ABT5MD54_9BURK|nr:MULTISPECIES: NADPH-dependent FMN reductase [unclassified Curvibacter]MDD0809426.1 NADPH-dependent FMN reductase [Curvibacter sp. RS43]MDD0814523.1 NADPH-dependent FMN reductase [Curvibacter sp. HBC28]
MTVLLIAGSPSARSRSSGLLDSVGQRLQQRGVEVDRIQIRDLAPEALVLADFGHPSILQAIAQVERASAIVVSTPVYKAAYSGVLKVFLDLLPQTALKGKTVLPLATGGSPHHMLALDYTLRPVLQSLAARHILPGVYATDAQIAVTPEGAYQIGPDIGTRLDEAVGVLQLEAYGQRQPLAGFAPIPFDQVRCSV